MKIFTFLILLFANYIFCQSTLNGFTLEIKNIKDIPYYTTISDKTDTGSILKINYKFLDSLNFHSLSYNSFDKLKIKGFLIEPKKKGIYPVLIFNRGGNADFGTIKFPFLIEYLAKIARKGYVVIGSQLRGNSVSEGNDEFGGKDVNDVLSLIDIIDQLPNVDKERIGVFGWSRGVMTNFLMLKKTNRIKTNISIAGLADLSKTDRQEMFAVYRDRIPKYSQDSIKALKSRNSLLAIDSIQNNFVSHFIIQGNKDERVKIDNAFEFYKKLNSKNYTTRLLIYENEDHGLKNVTSNLIDEIIYWLKKHL